MIANITLTSNEDLVIENETQDEDIIFEISDGGVATEVARVDGSSANFGIGDTAPTEAKLVVRQNGANDIFEVQDSGAGVFVIADGGDVGFGAASVASARSRINTDGSAVFNEVGAAVDFRIESDNYLNTFFVDGSADNVGIGTPTPDGRLHVGGAGTDEAIILEKGSLDSGSFIWHDGSTQAAHLTLDGVDDLTIENEQTNRDVIFKADNGSTSTEFARLDGSAPAFVFNETGATVDVRIEGDTDAHLFFADASADFIGINDSSPTATLDVDGTIDFSAAVLNNANALVFEGGTANAFETTLSIQNPTADNFITVPDTTGTLIVDGGDPTFNTVSIDGTLTADGDATIGSASNDDVTIMSEVQNYSGNNVLILEGSTDDTNEVVLAVADAGADATVTIPATTGTLITTGDSGTITSTIITDNTIQEADLEGTNSPTDNYALTYDSATDGFTWVDPSTFGGSTTLDDAYNNGQTITVDGSGDLVFNLNSTQDFIIQDAGSDSVIISDTGAATFNELGSDADFRVEGDADSNLFYTDAGNDRVGIGTATPDSKLHVFTATAGAVTANTNADDIVIENSGHAGLSFLNPDNQFGRIYFGAPTDNDAGQIIYGGPTSSASDAMLFFTDGSERVRIDSAGDLGVGTTSPSYKVDVDGAIRTGTPGTDGQLRIYSEQGATDYEYIINPNAAATQNVTLTLPVDDGDASEVLTTDGSGNLTWEAAGGGSSEWTDTGTIVHPTEPTVDEIVIGGTTEGGADIFLGVDGTAVFNEQGNSVDFKIEGDTDTELFYVDASTNAIGIGTSTPESMLDIQGNVNIGDETNPGSLSLHAASSGDEGGQIDFETINTGVDGPNLTIDAFQDNLRTFRNDADSAESAWTLFQAGAGGNWNMGINTTAPDSTLDVVENETGVTTNNKKVVEVTNSTNSYDTTSGNITNYGGYFLNSASESAGGNTLTNVGIYASATTGDTNYAAIFENGNVGVGTTTPSNLLSVSDTTNSGTDALVSVTAAGTTQDSRIQYNTNSSPWTQGVDASASYNWTVSQSSAFGTNDYFVIETGGDVGIGNTNPTALLDVDGDAIFNESGADVDFKIEGDTETSLFYVDASTDNVGIGNSTPAAKLEVTGDADEVQLKVIADSAQSAANVVEVNAFSGGTYMNIDNFGDAYFTAALKVNEGGGSFGDFTVESNNNANMIFSDASADVVGFNTSSPTSGDVVNMVFDDTGVTTDNTAILSLSDSSATINTDASSLTHYGMESVVSATNSGIMGNILTNTAGYFSATGGDANYGIVVANGDSGFGTTVPAYNVHAYENDTSTFAQIVAEQDGSGDAAFMWDAGAPERYVAGIDNSDSDKWKLVDGLSLGTSGEILNVSTTETTFNESSEDRDFRIEGNGDANLFFVDAGNDRVGIGTNSVDTNFQIEESNTDTTPAFKINQASTGDASAAFSLDGGKDYAIGIDNSTTNNDFVLSGSTALGTSNIIEIDGSSSLTQFPSDVSAGEYEAYNDSDTFIDMGTADNIDIDAGGIEFISITEGATTDDLIINEDSNTINFRVESNNNANAINLNAGTDRVGVMRAPTTYAFEVQGDAGKTVGGALWQIISDKRLKDNITTYTSGLDKLKQVQPVSFEFNGLGPSQAGNQEVGFIAQEIENIFPDTISVWQEYLNPGDPSMTDLKGFNASELQFTTINAIHDLDFNMASNLAIDDSGDVSIGMHAPRGVRAYPNDGGSLTAGNYYYKVTAIDGGSNESIASEEVSTYVDGTETAKIVLSWAPVAGATSYRIYKGTTSGGQDEYFTTSSTTYTDTGASATSGSVPGSSTADIIRLSTSDDSWFTGGNVGIGTKTPNSALQVDGSFSVRRVSASGTSDFSSADEVIIGVTNTSVERTIILETEDVIAGRMVVVKDETGGAGTNNITVATDGAELIDGQGNKVIDTNYGVLRVYSDGSNWFTW